MLLPDRLKIGDKIAIISPASVVKAEYIDSAAEFIVSNAYEPVIMPHAKGPADGSYAASMENRLFDLLAAWMKPDIKAVLCARGGYGAVHLLPFIPGELLRENPRWLIGFSDISALHAISLSQGVASIHGTMARHWNNFSPEADEIIRILETGRMPEYAFERQADDGLPQNYEGEAEGMLIGGNMAVLNGLAATSFDLFAFAMKQDCILFIEDIAEPIYKIERILYRLYMQGVLGKIKGLLVGAFTETSSDRNFNSTQQMIEQFLIGKGLTKIPVAFGVPVGHIEGNMPLIEGVRIKLSVTPDKTIIRNL